jgi:hypothetical protein
MVFIAHSIYKMVIRKAALITVGIAFVSISCDKDDDVETRSFRMGFTPFPYEISVDAANYVYDRMDTEADIINHHFDNGVPWVEAFDGQEFHQQVMADWNYRKSKTNPEHKVYVSVTPIDFSRTGLAAYRGEADNMQLPAPWDSYRFNSEEVKTAYLNYCKRIIDFFTPDYFGMSIEANLLHVNNPTVWSDYKELHNFIYAELKDTYPQLPVFTSVAGAHLLPGFIDGNDYVNERLVVLQLLEYSDLYAISFYPYMSKFLGAPYPDNTFDELFHISEKPLAIAETGYVAQTFSIDVGTSSATIESDQTKQQKYFKDLLEACSKRKTEFVINFVLRDYDKLWEQIGSPTDINIAWRDSGFYDEHGNTRLVHNTWRDYLSRKFESAKP